MHLSRGFAGAITYAFEKDRDTVRLDFLPLVITTSTPMKTIMGEAFPAVVERTSSSASDEDRARMRAYHQKVLAAMEEAVPPEHFTKGSIQE
jgi:hypothetical protein